MIKNFNQYIPQIHQSAFVFPQALVIGKVQINENVSVWPGCVLRGDVEDIFIGSGTNIQDGTIIHTSYNLPVIIGSSVTIGLSVVLHGCRIGNNCLIGMGAIILDGAVVEDNCIIGAGAVVTENSKIPEGTLALGIPAKVKRPITEEETNHITQNSAEYMKLKEEYKKND